MDGQVEITKNRWLMNRNLESFLGNLLERKGRRGWGWGGEGNKKGKRKGAGIG